MTCHHKVVQNSNANKMICDFEQFSVVSICIQLSESKLCKTTIYSNHKSKCFGMTLPDSQHLHMKMFGAFLFAEYLQINQTGWKLTGVAIFVLNSGACISIKRPSVTVSVTIMCHHADVFSLNTFFYSCCLLPGLR